MTTMKDTAAFLATKDCRLTREDDGNYGVRLKATGAKETAATLELAAAAGEKMFNDYQQRQVEERATKAAHQKLRQEERAAATAEANRKQMEAKAGLYSTFATRAASIRDARSFIADVPKVEGIFLALESSLCNQKESLDDFALKFALDPCHALRWGEDVIQAAAMESLLLKWLGYIEGQFAKLADTSKLPALLMDEANSAIFRAASSPSRSSSPMANLTDQADAKAWTNLVELIRWHVGS